MTATHIGAGSKRRRIREQATASFMAQLFAPTPSFPATEPRQSRRRAARLTAKKAIAFEKKEALRTRLQDRKAAR